jgi:hypothetical protein
MMRFTHLISWLLLAVGLAGVGCRMLDDGVTLHGQSPLRPARQSPDSVAIEMMWVRFPDGDPLLNDDAWLEIDETQIDPAVRRELANNGFRVGVISGNLPDAMARALDQKGAASKDEADEGVVGQGETRTLDYVSLEMMDEPVVRGHVKQLRRQERWEIQASDVFSSMPVLEPDGKQLRGATYADAQAMYALRVDPQPDRTVLVQLTPELHYGPYRPRWTGEEGQGLMMQASMRERKVYTTMQMKVRLSVGEMLVLMNMPNAGSRLGEYFHTVESSRGRQQKLILLRLAQVPPSDTFAQQVD